MLKNRKPPVASISKTCSARPDASTVRHRARPTVASPARGEETASADPEATSSIAKGVPVTVPTSAPVAVNDDWNGLPPASARRDPQDDPQALYRHPFKDMRHLATVEDDDDPVIDASPETTTDHEAAPPQDRDTNEPAVPLPASEPTALPLPKPENATARTPASLPDGPDGDRFGGTSSEDGAATLDKGSGGDQDYEVGYGRPPKETQFKKGRSGNPDGRPKGSRNSTTIVTELLNTRLATKVNGRPKKLPSREIAFTKIMMKALTGDLKSLVFLLQFDQPDGPTAPAAAPMESDELSASERALLAHAMANDLREGGLTETQIAAFLSRQGLDPDGEGQ